MQQDEYKERKTVLLCLQKEPFGFLTLRSPGYCLGRHKWCSCDCNPDLPGSVKVLASVPAAKSLHIPRDCGDSPGC